MKHYWEAEDDAVNDKPAEDAINFSKIANLMSGGEVAPEEQNISPCKYTITPRCRDVIQLAGQEAARLGKKSADTGDLLVGILKASQETACVGCRVLWKLGVSLSQVRRLIEELAAQDAEKKP
jgi:ATP-dependent Clp protease ATP-binding subunit ClpA